MTHPLWRRITHDAHHHAAMGVYAGKYLTIPRTEGISTTDIVGRMLLMTRDHHATGLPLEDDTVEVSCVA